MRRPRGVVTTAEAARSHEPDAGTGVGRVGSYAALVVLGSLLVLVLAGFAYVVSARSLERMVQRGNDAAALITASMVEREFDHWLATMRSHAGLPGLAAAVEAGDVAGVRQRLDALVGAHGRLDRAFVTDTTGLLWADSPAAPESLGRRFDDRDWFRGVSGTRSAYVSEVYRRNAEPRIMVVAVAAPVLSRGSGEVIGFVVAQVRLDGLSGLLRRVEVGAEGAVLLRDHAGSLAAHPSLELPDRRHDEYADVRLTATAAAPEVARGRYADPVSGRAVLASAVGVDVGGHRWTVISQQPVEAALAPIRGLGLRLGGAGVLMAALVGVLLWGLVRENARRRQAERGLVAVNEELERRVEARTAALKDKEDQLAQARKMEAVGRLAGGVAHDFNNLLTVIMGSTELLLLDLAEERPERKEIEQVREAAERAADLTRQLLAFSRKQVMQPEVLNLNEAVQRMRGILERVIGEHIDLVWRLAPDVHPIKFDPGQIEQVIMNLAVNARDAMPGGGKLTIETANVDLDEEYAREHVDARSGPHVMLAVTDTGVGMDVETRRRIFEPFYTTKRLGQGTGLGLSTVYGVVRQGGGNIWVYSEPGRGTTFKVYLPRTDDVPRPRQGPRPYAARPASGTVLVAEDETAVRELLVRVLSGAGYDVLQAADGEAAEALFRSRDGAVDLLLTDVVLPDISGPELAARLEGRQDGLRVLYMSGYTDNAIIHHRVLDEDAAFLEKPFSTTRLLDKVREQLYAPAR